jgi:hypothetical protein
MIALERTPPRVLVPIEEIVSQSESGLKRWQLSRKKLFLQLAGTVALHREKLGTSRCVEKGTGRSWTWSQRDWSVKIGKKILEFKVRSDFTPREAWDAWRSYLKLLGVNDALNMIK